ncbi:PepSY domain-containing protein [Massilia sp. MB5]|uniref:PepSY domain-containing protein n=1 Tax=Massilia sp. MB5 TaxID=2919578 RepID=UPI001F1177A4|nr:PepSY domain-containing protein [Massilia sp. MB5]UMR29699.1 PepSY domain-containing protein [Massilia sp. MB5]
MALLIASAMGSWKRQLHLLHRWLGIGIGLLVLLWFGSGIVMMYVPYPKLSEQERMAWLPALDAAQVKVSAWDAWQSTAQPGTPGAVKINTVAGRPVYHFMSNGRWWSVWADTGAALHVTEAMARTAALSAAPTATALSVDQIDLDQWTFGPVKTHRPLYRVAADDAAGSVLYVSGRTGELVRDTTRSERAWNWAGSIIHWIYFTPLRTHGQPWRQVVMWTSGAAFLLVMAGMVLGIQRVRLRQPYASGRRSPYRGWQAWHHWLGLGIGTLTLTWLFSGWLSVTPFDWLSSPGVTAKDRLAFAGGPLNQEDLSVVFAPAIRARPGLLELEWRRVGGKLYFSALERTGRRLLHPESGAVLPSIPNEALLPAVRATRPDVPLLAVDLLASGDSYYYSHHADRPFPVMRVQFRLADETSFYVDPAQGTLVGHADRNGKWNRWLFNGLHQLDFAASLRTRPVWDVMVASLSVLGAMLSITGLVLGWRRLSKRRTKPLQR